MGSFTKYLAASALALSSVNAAPAANEIRGRQSGLTVNLGYSTYQGYQDPDTGLNNWKGIRFAQAPVGNLRWKAPQTPLPTSGVLPATEYGNQCAQSVPSVPFAGPIPGNEDCLFLNVQAPPVSGSTKLPVMVWIHGGGYGFGNSYDGMAEIVNDNNNGFIGVSIHYRLGAFGFLSSEEVKSEGATNAGLLDIEFALKWVQQHIGKFGGDPRRVTITGESAGAGAVMLMAIMRKGSLGESLFMNGIAASPYMPPQHDYNAAVPTKLYYDFAAAVGCGSSGAVLDCLRSKDTDTLQQANFQITTSQAFGTWAYYPVTDFSFIPSRITVGLASGKLNGQNMLVGGNANEGAMFVPTTLMDGMTPNPIITDADLKAWIKSAFPTFNDSDIQKVLDANPISDTNPNAPKFETNGLTGKTAVEVSQIAAGNQQRANNIYAEAVFLCPSYWLSDAYGWKGRSYHYQFSVPFAGHGDDVRAAFGGPGPQSYPSHEGGFKQAFRKIWGNMVIKNNPSIPSASFDQWVKGPSASMVNLNTTGGVPWTQTFNFAIPVQAWQEPGLSTAFNKVNAYTWEGGRGKRCDFWKTMATKIGI